MSDHSTPDSPGKPEASGDASPSPARLIRVVVLLSLAFATFGCDQASKDLAARHLEGAGVRPVVGRVVVLVYAENTGAFLSLGANLPPTLRAVFLAAIPLAIVVGMTAYALAVPTISWTAVVGLGFIVGGGAGNLSDRLFAGGAVVDFINIGVGPVRTGVFNVADLAIMLGCLLLLIGGTRRHRQGT